MVSGELCAHSTSLASRREEGMTKWASAREGRKRKPITAPFSVNSEGTFPPLLSCSPGGGPGGARAHR